jgi:hypothetical protein
LPFETETRGGIERERGRRGWRERKTDRERIGRS